MDQTKQSPLGKILMDTARDLAYAQRDGKPLGPVQAEGAARIAQHYAPRLCDDCRTEIDSGHQCRSCANFEARTFGDGDDS